MGAKYVAIPPDGGWGWVIIAASFFCNLVVDGIIFSFGIFVSDIMAAFGETQARTALVGSLLSGFYLMAGPFVSALANKYGFRVVTLLGAVVGCIGFGLSYFATSVTFLYVTYGIIGGIGFGLIYVPAVIAVGFYFERWRALATGVAVCGSGIGTFLMAPFCGLLIEMYTWRGALLIQAGIILNCAIFGALFRPIKPTLVITDDDDEDEEKINENQAPLLAKKIARELELRKSASFASIPENSRLSIREKRLSTYSQQSCPPDAIRNGSGSNLDIAGDGYLAVPDLNPVQEEGNNVEMKVFTSSSINRNLHSLSRKNSGLVQRGGSRRASRARTISESSRAGSFKKPEAKPLQREDIYFTGSMQRLPQYTSQGSLAYHASVTRLPPMDFDDNVEGDDIETAPSCCAGASETLTAMLDVSLLTSPTFILLCVSGFLTMMGFFVPFMYLTGRAEDSGMSHSMAVWLVSSIGITNTVGRVLCGVVSSMPGINALFINNAALTVGGIATMFSGLSMGVIYQFTYSCIFGLAIACFASLRSIILVDLLGLEKLTNAFGLLLLCQGVAATIGAPIAGAFLDLTGSYDMSFYISGGLILLSGVMCYPLNRLHAWEKNRNNNV